MVIVVRPHESAASANGTKLIDELNQRGMAVAWPDLASLHESNQTWANGVTQAQRMHAGIQATRNHLTERDGSSGRLVAVIGDGLTALMASAAFTEVKATVLESMNDPLRAALQKAKRSPALADLDPCAFVPGLLRVASTPGLLELIAPRPLLLLNATEDVIAQATVPYRGGTSLSYQDVDLSAASAREADWLATQLVVLPEQREALFPHREEVLVRFEASPGAESPALTPSALAEMQGAPLPMASTTLAMDLAPRHERWVETQTGIRVPMTIFRPGPAGGEVARGLLIAVADGGRTSLEQDEVVLEAQRRQWMVWTVDPRGVGTLSLEQREPFAFLSSLWLGEHFVWRQASDIARIVERLGRTSVQQPTALYVRGPMMSLAALYVGASIPGALEWIRIAPEPSGTMLPATYHSFTREGPMSIDRLRPQVKVPLVTGPTTEFFLADWTRLRP